MGQAARQRRQHRHHQAGQRAVAVYYHLSYIAVKEGDKVQAGQEIGRLVPPE